MKSIQSDDSSSHSKENHFGDRLANAVRSKKSAVCVGLDPRFESLPKCLKSDVDQNNRMAVANLFSKFCCQVIDAIADVVPVVKPQSAFFEQIGVDGMFALKDVIQYAIRAGLLVILDGKRGDIGTTAEAYADAYLGRGDKSAWGADALTVNPFLGDDTLQPFIDRGSVRGAGVFVLVKTSNLGSGFLQDRVADGQPLYQHIADTVQRLAQTTAGQSGYGNVGAVVGATYPRQLAELRQRMPNVWILIPGYGAQGGTAEDVAGGFDLFGQGAIVNSSRGIIFAYQQESNANHRNWQDAVNAAARGMTGELQAVLP